MQKRITLQDIAREIGVHYSTVSRGLRNDPRLPPATRKQIQATARRLGYRPDPMAKALAIYRQAIRPSVKHGSMVLLSPIEKSAKPSPLDGLIESLQTKADEYGYQLDQLAYHEPGLSGERLTRILKARGTVGLLVLPDPIDSRHLRRLQLDWSRFPAVALGRALLWPMLHSISDDHFRNAKRTVRGITAMGYRRIGLCIGAKLSAIHSDGGWLGGYLAEMSRWGNGHPPFYHNGIEPDAPAIRRWIQAERLDSIIVDSDVNAFMLRAKCRLRVPEELGVATFMSNDKVISGINPDFKRVWVAAVDFLVHLINTQQRGVPPHPQRILLEGTWVPGQTLRRLTTKPGE